MPDLEVRIFYPYFDGFNRLKNDLKRRDQNPLPDHNGHLAWVDWTGNFQPEEAFLWTGSQGTHDGPLKIIFHPANGKKVKAVGLQLQAACHGKFTAVMDVYDSAGHFLDELSREGLSTDFLMPRILKTTLPSLALGQRYMPNRTFDEDLCAGGFCINQLSIDY